MARYFIGLMAPAAIQKGLTTFIQTIQSALPSCHAYKVSWNALEDLHCTLLYIGPFSDEQRLVRDMQRVAATVAPVTVNISGATHWLGQNSLVLAATGAERPGTKFVTELGHFSSDQLAGRRPFYGHVTLGRVRPVPDRENDLFAGLQVEPLHWTATHVQLVKSHESKVAPRYETVAQADLEG